MAYVAALFVGLLLGMLGAGGSVLSVPLLVYGFSIEPVEATVVSLAIVFIASFIGMLGYAQQRKVHYPLAAGFALICAFGIVVSRGILMPLTPDQIYFTSALSIGKGSFIMTIFAAIMIIVAVRMIRITGKAIKPQILDKKRLFLRLFAAAFGVGILTGYAGVGGGFLIVPILTELLGLGMHMAVGTSLMIIATNSLVGLTTGVLTGATIDWWLVGRISIWSTFGMIGGFIVNQFVPAERLRPLFGILLLTVALYVVIFQIFL